MKIKRIKARNFGPYENLKAENLTDGLVGIVGPNGSGKSTLVEALYSCLTGKFRKYPDLADFIMDLPNGQKANSASIELVVEHGMTEMTIKRSLSLGSNGKATQTAKLTVSTPGNEEEQYSGVNPVNSKLIEILGVEPELLGQYVFIEQDALSDIVDSDKSTRTKTIQRLFGLDRYEGIWDKLGRASNGIPDSKLLDDIKELETALTKLEADNHITSTAIQTVNDDIRAVDVTRAQSVISAWETSSDGSSKIAVATERVASMRKQKEELVASRTHAADERDYIAGITADTSAFEAAEALLKKVQYYVVDTKIHSKNMQEMERCVAELNTLVEPQKPADSWTTEEDVVLNTALVEFNQLKDFLNKYSGISGEVAICPTCSQPITDIAAELKKRRKESEDLERKIHELSLQKQIVATAEHAYTQAYNAFTKKRDSLIDCGTQIAARVSEFEQQYPAEAVALLSDQTKVDEAKAKIDTFNRAKVKLELLTNKCTEFATAISDIERKLSIEESNLANLNASMSKTQSVLVGITPEHIDNFRLQLQKVSDFKCKLAQLTERKAQTDTQIAATTLRIETVKRSVQQVEREKHVKLILTTARDVFHRSKLPLYLSKRFISVIDRQVKKFLDIMQSDFTADFVVENDSYDFKCTFLDASSRKGSLLSGGEKIRFAIAFLLAVNEVLASKLGILVLDEPTVWLDDQNVKHLEEALRHVQRYAKNAGLQLFLITHNSSLASILDSTIRVSKQHDICVV